MIELTLKKMEQAFENDDSDIKSFTKPIVFFKVHKQDERKLFLTFIIFDAMLGKITYLFSYNKDNVFLVDSNKDSEKYKLRLVPHSTIEIQRGIDFYAIMQEEQIFMYVNYKDCIIRLYTMEDIITDKKNFKTISSTFYKDDSDNNYFFLAANDVNNILYIYRMSLDLKNIELVDSFEGRNIPPHVVRKYRDCILLSHEFNESLYYSKQQQRVLDSFEMGSILVKNSFKIKFENPEKSSFEQKELLYELLRKNYDISCVPGAIILLDLFTKEKHVYRTSGGSPAHFEIDHSANMIYVSSHNFFNRLDSISMFEPAVFDKFEFLDNKLVWQASFSYSKGFRYASHRVFYNCERPYICTFGHPNRLTFIDAVDMKLYYYDDIGCDELSSQKDVSTYINSRNPGGEFVSLEVSQNGENIIFMDERYIYIYNFVSRKVCHRIEYLPSEKTDWDDYILRTLHIMFLQ